MKYMTRSNQFKASAVNFEIESLNAYSYDWWLFVSNIDGKLVFNSYRYSPTTGKHQSKIRTLLRNLGLKIDLEIESPKGLQNLNSSINHYILLIDELKKEINKPRTQKKKNLERKKQINFYKKKIEQVKKLLKAV